MTKRERDTVICVVLSIVGLLLFLSLHLWSLMQEDEPKFIDVDGKRCHLYKAKIGERKVHGVTRPIFETRATCVCTTCATSNE